MNVYVDDDVVAKYTDELISSGMRLFSFYRKDKTEATHVRKQLDCMNLPYGAKVLDCGCGVGEFARLAKEIRPDVSFVLLNISKSQLDRCPDDAEKIQADMHSIPVSDKTFDAVLVDYVICHSRLVEFLDEVARVLKNSGILFLHEIFADDTDVAKQFYEQLNAIAYNPYHVLRCADKAGFVMTFAERDSVTANMPKDIENAHGEMIGKMIPMSMRFVKAEKNVAETINKHSNIALHFSGGKDSTAILYLLRPWLDNITVYWCDTGDTCPETVAVIEEVKEWIPKFRTIKSNSKQWRKENGIPSDIVPVCSHVLGVSYGMSETLISNKFDCCYNNLMLPMHNAMIEDKVDLVIRGTKLTDTGKVPAEGKTDFYKILLPIKEWSHDDVFRYLEEVDAPKNAIYEDFKGISAPECLTCSAWWDDNKTNYLKKYHPKEYDEYRNNLRLIAGNVVKNMKHLNEELAAGE